MLYDVFFFLGTPDIFSPNGIHFRVLRDGSDGDLVAKFQPGDWTLSGSIYGNQGGYTFSGVNPAEEFGTFHLSCTPLTHTVAQNEIEEEEQGGD